MLRLLPCDPVDAARTELPYGEAALDDGVSPPGRCLTGPGTLDGSGRLPSLDGTELLAVLWNADDCDRIPDDVLIVDFAAA